jgi:glycosyltransferase involved in cell wall biosynthesis
VRILLVGNDLADAQQSMTRYAEWLLQALQARGLEATVMRPQAFFSRLTRHRGGRKYLGYLDKFLIFPPRLRRQARQYDLVHVLDHANSMYLRVVGDRPRLITCHDLLAVRSARGAFAGVSVGWSGRILQRWILSGLRQAPNLLCVSQKTAGDLQGLTGGNGQRTWMVNNTLNWGYHPAAARADGILHRLALDGGRAYLLHVGGNQWNKNRVGVLRIFARLRDEDAGLRLVMAGEPFTPQMRSVVLQEGLQESVMEAVNIANEELQELYSHALALLFPSLEEGFGWPVLEAQACGCPVITSHRPPMTEVAGAAAILIDPGDPAAAAQAIFRGLSRRAELIAEGFRNLRRFDPETIVDRYCGLYAEILDPLERRA